MTSSLQFTTSDRRRERIRADNSSTGDLQLSEQKQDQQDDDHQSEAATTVVSGAIERTAANAAKAAEQGNHQNDQYDRSDRHRFLRSRPVPVAGHWNSKFRRPLSVPKAAPLPSEFLRKVSESVGTVCR